MSDDVAVIRTAFESLESASAHEARTPPRVDEIFAPDGHAAALDPERPVVVGGRGMGKSFWAGALASPETLGHLAKAYPRLGLDECVVRLGFAAGDMQKGGPPSREVLNDLCGAGHSPETLWRAIVWRCAMETMDRAVPGTWRETVARCAEDPERLQSELHRADAELQETGRKLVVVFDALDRMGDDWAEIRRRSKALLRVALAMRGYPRIKLKLFVRSDQFADDALFDFPDASKLKTAAVDLQWARRDLYGLAFTRVRGDRAAHAAFDRLVACAVKGQLPYPGLESESAQEMTFEALAGPYMGKGPRRGKTYPWLHNHLGDALGRVSPRSFLIALRQAAEHRPAPTNRVFDPKGLETGVRAASETRVDQLGEEHLWIKRALELLADLRVPCEAEDFRQRWEQAGTTREVRRAMDGREYPGPLEMAGNTSADSDALLEALRRIAVVERRPDGRINIPDIFRIAAKLLKRGGVPPRR